jgi:AraC-like DNA-binding protein
MNREFVIRSKPVLPLYRIMMAPPVLARIANRYGISTETYLAGSGISPIDLTDPTKLISSAQELFLIRRFEDLVSVPWRGLEVGAEIQFSDQGPLGLAVLCCGTLREVMELITRYMHLSSSFHQYEYRIKGSDLTLTMREITDLGVCGRGMCEANIVMTNAAAGILLETPYALREVHFAFPEQPYLDKYEEYLHCPVKFNAPAHKVFFPSRIMDTPIRFANPLMKAAMLEECENLSRRIAGHETLSARVRHELLFGKGQFPSLGELARRIGLSPRTIRRRLGYENTSFMDILTEVRREKAKELIGSTKLRMEAVAERLGFSTVSSFHRAFKTWEGFTPGAYREKRSATREH